MLLNGLYIKPGTYFSQIIVIHFDLTDNLQNFFSKKQNLISNLISAILIKKNKCYSFFETYLFNTVRRFLWP